MECPERRAHRPLHAGENWGRVLVCRSEYIVQDKSHEDGATFAPVGCVEIHGGDSDTRHPGDSIARHQLESILWSTQCQWDCCHRESGQRLGRSVGRRCAGLLWLQRKSVPGTGSAGGDQTDISHSLIAPSLRLHGIFGVCDLLLSAVASRLEGFGRDLQQTGTGHLESDSNPPILGTCMHQRLLVKRIQLSKSTVILHPKKGD